MKWGEFKKKAEMNGVTDEMEVCYEDANFGGNCGEIDMGDIIIDKDNNEVRLESKRFQELD